jgi:hypothetical protein
MALAVPPVKTALRQFTMLLTLTMGVLLIAGLWQSELSLTGLQDAGRGTLFLLLALGLMGTRRLSLIITGLLCCAALPPLLSGDSPRQMSDWLALLTLMLCAGLSLAPSSRRTNATSH